MRTHRALALLTVPWLAAAGAAGPLTPEQAEKVRAAVRPQAAEQKWEQIPWRTSLWDARKQAAAEGKPILLWEMDGHPLGCV
jgi:hypothetical protein